MKTPQYERVRPRIGSRGTAPVFGEVEVVSHFGPTTCRVKVLANGHTVTLFDDSIEFGEVEHLWRWKQEAMQVLAAWDRLWEDLGKPGKLGQSKVEASREHILKTLESLRGGFLQAHMAFSGSGDRVAMVCMRAHHANANRVIEALGGEVTPLPDLESIVENGGGAAALESDEHEA